MDKNWMKKNWMEQGTGAKNLQICRTRDSGCTAGNPVTFSSAYLPLVTAMYVQQDKPIE